MGFMTESTDKDESASEIRRRARRLIAAGGGIGIWFLTMVLFVNYGPTIRSGIDLLTVAAFAIIPAVAGTLIVLGILRYVEASKLG